MNNNLEKLRSHLFSAIDSLMDEKNPMEIDRAKAVSDVAQTIINSAKLEVDYMKATGQTTTKFLGGESGVTPITHEPRVRRLIGQ